MTEQDLKTEVRKEYREVLGKLLLVTRIDGYDNHSVVGSLVCEPPALVRVVPTEDIELDNFYVSASNPSDTWIDPRYKVELVEPHPHLEGMSEFFVYGTSYSGDGEVEPATDWSVKEDV